MTKRQKRQIIIAVSLLLVLLLLGTWFYFYKQTKRLGFELVDSSTGAIPMPEFLFSFNGEGGNRLQRPIGVLVDDGTVYVSDSVRSRIFTFDEEGDLTGSFGASETVNPLYLAKNPKNGNIYVTDRRRYAVLQFTPEGEFVGEFEPKLPKSELPTFDTRGVQWQPVAIGFADDGTMFVTEILNGHRLLVFDPEGRFVRSTGDVGLVDDPADAPEVFQFPNGILVIDDEVYVADSNNQRVKVYSKDGVYQRMIVTMGLPRGLAPLDRFPGEDEEAPTRFVQTDTLAHDATIWTTEGERALSFGERGVLNGQFSYPGAAALGTRNRIFIADTSNGRVQAWGWPLQAAGLPPIDRSTAWWCLSPLLLLPLLFLRRKQYFATPDFVEAMLARERADAIPAGRRRWIATQSGHEAISALDAAGIELGRVFEVFEHSPSDVKALMERYEFDEATAITLSVAARARIVCVEDEDLRRMAKMMELDVVNADEFLARFSRRDSK